MKARADFPRFRVLVRLQGWTCTTGGADQICQGSTVQHHEGAGRFPALSRARASTGMDMYNSAASPVTSLLDKYGITHLQIAVGVAVLYVVGMVVYVLFFSPLRNIPGKLISKLTLMPLRVESVLGTFGDTCESDYYKYGDIYVAGPSMVVLSNPADCRKILGSHQFKKSEFYQAFALIDDTIFTTQSAELTHLRRRQVGPAFTHGYLAEMESTILDCGIVSVKKKWDSILAQSTDGKATVNYSLHFSLTTFDVISALGYGQKFHALRDNETQIVRWVNNYNKLAICHVAIPFATYFPVNLITRSLIKSRNEFVDFGNAAAEQRREMLRFGNTEKPRDILQALLDGEDPESKAKMTPTQVTAENIGFLIGGTDTTSLTMTWTLHYLMLYPDVYKKAVVEVRSAFAHDHLVTFAEGRVQLPYIEACIYESMRIRAVSGVFLPRIVPKGGATFQGHFIPEGTEIGVNVAGLNHHLGTWDSPQRFMPERFVNNERAKQNVMTFSTGVRICPGRNLAWVEMITIIANLLKDYDFELPEDSLFGPDKLDSNGNPIVMPRTHTLTIGPKYPERDCRIVAKSFGRAGIKEDEESPHHVIASPRLSFSVSASYFAPGYFFFFFLLLAMLIDKLLQIYQSTGWHVLGTAIALYASARIVYSLLFSPVRHIPGRFITKLSSVYFKYVSFTGYLADSCEEDYYKYGDIYTLAPNLVVLSEPSDCKRVLNTYSFPKSDLYDAFQLLDETIFTTNSAEVNRTRRKLIGPAFTHGNLAQMEPTILDCGILSIKKKWDEAIQSSSTGTTATIVYEHHFFLASFEIISTLAYGQRSYVLEKEETELLGWHKDYTRLGIVQVAVPFVSLFPFKRLTKKLWQSVQNIADFGDAVAEKRRKLLQSGQIEKPSDILQTLIDAMDPETKTGLTPSEVTAENVGVLVAGTDTSALTMVWTLHYLLLHPDAYKRVVDEIRGAFPRDHLITYAEGREKLPYLEACIYESLRIRGVSAIMMPRVVPKGGATFQGHFLPEGTQVGISIAGLNHNKDIWDNPQRFNPERFLNNEAAKQNVMTFSAGVRVCPGRNLAWVEMTTILANLLKDYSIALPADSLFGPNTLDAHGNPIAMPRTHTLTVAPKYPGRDCRVLISKAPAY
ncbi:cytochrome P450 [Martensiomyces pterosporus]|nr:cytochrome P450 [Martensiomyces pterosporus]